MPLDKQAHLLSGIALALALGYLFPPIYGVLAALVAGALKELYDHFHPDIHTCDVWDFVATLSGGVAGGAFVFLSHR